MCLWLNLYTDRIRAEAHVSYRLCENILHLLQGASKIQLQEVTQAECHVYPNFLSQILTDLLLLQMGSAIGSLRDTKKNPIIFSTVFMAPK